MHLLRKFPVHALAIGIGLGLAIVSPGQACLWDSDTLATENARFPEVINIMTGLFPRHSQEYHAWRVLKSQALLDSGKAGLADYDDLAVSQHKLGHHKDAIQTMLAKEKRLPGKYETYSNLGTFHIYTGELDTALQWIDKALAINPNAHFGREKYQKWLVMWIQERERSPAKEPHLDDRHERAGGEPRGFAAFVARMEDTRLKGSKGPAPFTEKQRHEAVRGVTGMMYFADYDNPILQEALGDLLLVGGVEEDAAQFAAMCYLQMAEKVPAGAEHDRIQNLVEIAMEKTPGGAGYHRSKLMEKLNSARLHGLRLNETVRTDEIAWIAAGKDASREFQKKYLQPAEGDEAGMKK